MVGKCQKIFPSFCCGALCELYEPHCWYSPTIGRILVKNPFLVFLF
jgi:hypothetical protein